MLRSVMASGMFCDPDDPQEKDKLEALKSVGVDVVSGFMCITRPYAIAPWEIAGGKIDISRPNMQYWDHLCTFVKRCADLELGIEFQIINKWFIHELGYPVGVAYGEPTNAYAAALTELLHGVTQLIETWHKELRVVAILPVTEGGQPSKPMARWIRRTVDSMGLSSGAKARLHWISNSGLSTEGWIEQVHLHSVAEFRRYRGPYASTDGWAPSAREVRQIVDSQENIAAAIEYWHWALSGTTNGAYPTRQRPSIDFIVKKCGAALQEFGR